MAAQLCFAHAPMQPDIRETEKRRLWITPHSSFFLFVRQTRLAVDNSEQKLLRQATVDA